MVSVLQRRYCLKSFLDAPGNKLRFYSIVCLSIILVALVTDDINGKQAIYGIEKQNHWWYIEVPAMIATQYVNICVCILKIQLN